MAFNHIVYQRTYWTYKYLMPMKRTIIGLIISGVFIALIFKNIDLASLTFNGVNIDFIYIFLYALTIVVIFLAASLRWHMLLANNISFYNSFFSVVLGLGGNMILPARGGDLYRVYYISRMSRIAPAEILTKLFIEKSTDAVIVSLIGIFSILNLFGLTDNSKNIWAALLIIMFLCVAIIIIKYKGRVIEKILFELFAKLKLQRFFMKYIEGHIEQIEQWLTLRYLIAPFFVSLLLWVIAYAMAFTLISKIVGIELNYMETMFVVFIVALGMSIPAAPSGLGVIHASVMSAFLIMGKSAEQGLLLGTAIHLLQVIFFTIPALIVYLVTNGVMGKLNKVKIL